MWSSEHRATGGTRRTLQPGESRALSIIPNASTAGVVVRSLGYTSMSLQITHNQPLGTTYVLTLPGGGESMVIPPSRMPGVLGRDAMPGNTVLLVVRRPGGMVAVDHPPLREEAGAGLIYFTRVHPNPARALFTIEYALAGRSDVKVEVLGVWCGGSTAARAGRWVSTDSLGTARRTTARAFRPGFTSTA